MPRKGHSEEQIVYALRQVEGGQKVKYCCLGIYEKDTLNSGWHAFAEIVRV